MAPTVLITGCSSGIGRATALFFAAKGWNVAATMRNPGGAGGSELQVVPNVLVHQLDVTDRASADAAVAAAVARFGGLDAVVNNAGYALNGPGEFSTKAQTMAQFETNVYGPLAVTQAALSHFRARRAGVIVNVGSLVASTPFPFMPVYVASKAALDAMTAALNLELAPLGIRVKIVHPGVVSDTPHMSNIDLAENEGVPEYDRLMKGLGDAFPGLFAGLTGLAGHVANVLFEAVTDGTDRVRYPIGKDCLQFMAERKKLSDEEWETEMRRKFRLELAE